MDTSEKHTPDDAGELGPNLPTPAYPQQPDDGDRPVPPRAMPETTQDPADWDVAGNEPSSQRRPDHVLDERRRQEEAARRGGDRRHDAAVASGTEQESGYSTEIEQGAAPPRPRRDEDAS